jgi:hypothetical protein
MPFCKKRKIKPPSPCRGRYFLLVQKVTKDTLKGEAAGRTLRVLRPASPLRIPR